MLFTRHILHAWELLFKKERKGKILRIFRVNSSFQVTAIPVLPEIERPLGYSRRHFRHCEEPLRQKESSSLPKASSDRTLEARQEVTSTRALECRTWASQTQRLRISREIVYRVLRNESPKNPRPWYGPGVLQLPPWETCARRCQS